jgi:hypothetical protein
MGDPAVLFGCEETCGFGKWAMQFFFFSKKFPLDVFYSILQILHRNNIQKKTLEIAMLSTCDNFGKILGEKCLEAQLDLELHSQDQSAVCPIFRETYPLVI